MTVENRRAPGFYGAAVEDWVLDHYGLERSYEPVNGARMDAVVPENGQPVEIKAVALNRKGGRRNETRFKIWRDQHDALDRAGGYYVFVAYYLRSEGIAVQDAQSLRAESLNIDWYGDTVPRGSEQAELPARQLFG
jgi:hypothetical protein